MFSPFFLFPLILFCVSLSNVSSSHRRFGHLSEKIEDSQYDFHALKERKRLGRMDEEKLFAASEEGREMETKVSEMKSIRIGQEYEMQLAKWLDACDMRPLRKPITSLNAYEIAALSINGIQELISEALAKIGVDVDKESVKCASKAVANYKKVIMAKYEMSEKSERKHSRFGAKSIFESAEK
ncbi:hypothetical protein niasHT_023743 [Heterodera trifolii]|uniref:Uncharacterized protein n=1 Tax=Heterodera trifolii TaxID=157864 RepID=A0ABD2K1W9_9BILA